jgi:hypothetical protein
MGGSVPLFADIPSTVELPYRSVSAVTSLATFNFFSIRNWRLTALHATAQLLNSPAAECRVLSHCSTVTDNCPAHLDL